ncbi:tail assembly protein [Pseudomonas phage 8P]|nr:tail assembly protein [Pseudomonas phage 8P]
MAIKVFRSDQLGAPLINGVAGTLITALDAILVNGYGQVNVSSISRSSSTATVVTAEPHGFETGDVALIAGAVETEYNGEHQVTVIDSTTYTFAVAGTPTTPATGSITSKRAPAGFSKVFAGTNKGVYRSNDLSSRRHFFRVLDGGTTSGGSREAQLWGYEDMTDVDTGSGMYPTAAQYTYGFFWQKSDTADAVGRHWVLVTDGKTVYHFAYIQSRLDTSYSYNTIGNPATNMGSVAFGDLIEFKPGDAYASFVTGGPQPNSFSSTQYSGVFNSITSINNNGPSTSQALIMFARDFTAIPGARAGQVYASGLSAQLGQTAYIAYPHQIDNGFYMVPALVTQGAPSLIRGRMPGLFEPLHGPCFPNGTIIDNVQGYVGRKFMMLYGKNSSSVQACLLDITGPWDS